MKRTALTSLLLVAGSSRRFGVQNKLLQDWHGLPICVHALNSLLKSQTEKIVVVTGYQHELIQSTLMEHCQLSEYDNRVQFVQNESHKNGMGTSLAIGMQHIEDTADAVLVCLGDMPNVTAEIIDTLFATRQERPSYCAYVPEFGKRRGNPVLLSAPLFEEMRSLAEDKGARDLLNKYRESVLEVQISTEAIHFDIDAQSDL